MDLKFFVTQESRPELLSLARTHHAKDQELGFILYCAIGAWDEAFKVVDSMIYDGWHEYANNALCELRTIDQERARIALIEHGDLLADTHHHLYDLARNAYEAAEATEKIELLNVIEREHPPHTSDRGGLARYVRQGCIDGSMNFGTMLRYAQKSGDLNVIRELSIRITQSDFAFAQRQLRRYEKEEARRLGPPAW